MNQAQSNFLKIIAPAAMTSSIATGVPASVTIAQAIQESSNKQGWGQSTLARVANNYFGIKATQLSNPNTYIELPTHEFRDGVEDVELAKFARYPSPAASFIAHAKLLSTAGRYLPAMKERNDPAAFASQLQACGYSTSPDYAIALIKLINEYDLRQYDAQPIKPPAAPAKA
jgi:flagellum-specific peptidoglycan hydrolase FlgJ